MPVKSFAIAENQIVAMNYFRSSCPALPIYALCKCLKPLRLVVIADLMIQLKDKDKCQHPGGATWLCGMVGSGSGARR